MWHKLLGILSSSSGQVPDGQSESAPVTDEGSPVEINERAGPDDMEGVRIPYDSTQPHEADSSNPEPEEAQPAQQTQEESFAQDLNLDPETFTPEMKEIFKRMQAGYTKKMQRFKGYEGHLQNMERFYNDRDFAENTLKQWAAKNGFSVVPQQFNQQQPAQKAPEGSNALQHKVVEALKAKLPQETQWMADGHGAAIFEVMKEVLGPVLSEFQGFKTAKEENEWKTREQDYDKTEQEFAQKNPGWEAHEEDMSKVLAFLNDQNAYSHPQYGSKHDLLFRLVTGQSKAIKAATERIVAAPKNKTLTSAPGKKVSGGGFQNVQDEVAAVTDRKDAFALAATKALAQMRKRK